MDFQDLMIKAINYDYPEEIPISIGMLPALWKLHSKELIKICKRFPRFFRHINDDYDYQDHMHYTYRSGSYTDEWGCVWENIEEGMIGLVTGHPVKTREDIRLLKIPDNRDGSIPHGFMYLRLLDLRGFDEAMMDFADECEELSILIDKVTEYNCLQMEVLVNKANQRLLYFGDDLGMQNGLAIGPVKWRKYLKSSYKKIFEVPRKAGKYIYFHTDGMITEIIPDLFESGIHIVNPQYRANGLDNLVNICKGRYPVSLDLDRQLFPFATPSECKNHVFECVEALYQPSGGLCLNIELGPCIPLENIEALIEAADQCRLYK